MDKLLSMAVCCKRFINLTTLIPREACISMLSSVQSWFLLSDASYVDSAHTVVYTSPEYNTLGFFNNTEAFKNIRPTKRELFVLFCFGSNGIAFQTVVYSMLHHKTTNGRGQ